MEWCDCHCHLDDASYDGEREQVIERCLQAGVSTLVTVADPYAEESMGKTLEMSAAHPEIRTVIAAHPHQASQYSPDVERRIFRFVEQASPVGIGETGLDFHYHFSPPEDQRRVLRRQLAIASELKLPVIIHSRQAEAEILDILQEERFAQPVVFHCYTGDMATAQEILRRGHTISISGIVTFKKADDLRRIVETIPLGQLLTETDSPYLSPEPFRGQTNTPVHVDRVVAAIAAVKMVDMETIAQAVKKNLSYLMRGK